jgi:hypothetical protein
MADDKQGQSEKLELRSPDPAEARRTEIARLFPEARTEGGKVDFDQLTVTSLIIPSRLDSSSA